MIPNRNVYGKPKKSAKGQSLWWVAQQTVRHMDHIPQDAWRKVPKAAEKERSEAAEAQVKRTPFEKAVHDLTHCERVISDLTFGRRIGFYQIRDNIGSGNFSQVKLGIHDFTKEQVAIKILDKVHLDKRSHRLFSSEISCMEKLCHPNIVRLYEVVETFRRVHLVMEYAAGGELYSSISSRGRMCDMESKLVFSQILSAVQYMHDNHIVHRDLKAENVFFSAAHVVKVGDFGFSTECEPGKMLRACCGSPPYAAPELFQDEAYVGVFVDLWALGVLLYFMVTAMFPFNGAGLSALRVSVLRGSYAVPAYVPAPCRSVIEGLLTLVPTQRSPLAQVMASDWLDGVRYPPPYPPTSPTPEHLAGSVMELSTEEQAVRAALEDLGITEEHLKNNTRLDCRSPLTGAYRIVLHRTQKSSWVEQVGCTTLHPQHFQPSLQHWPHPTTTFHSAVCSIL